MIQRLVGIVNSLSLATPMLVAVDGADASGKTTFAKRLGEACETAGHPVVRIELDNFLAPRSIRYQRGVASPEGFFEDSYDLAAFKRQVLLPLVSGDRRIVPSIFDRATDSQVHAKVEEVPQNTVVIVDGGFLLRKELREFWSLSIFLEVTEQERLRRALTRDTDRLGGTNEVQDRYQTRYFPGFALYLDRETPLQYADVILENSDVDHPAILKWPNGAAQ